MFPYIYAILSIAIYAIFEKIFTISCPIVTLSSLNTLIGCGSAPSAPGPSRCSH